ncbi:UspA domain protein [Halorubrum aidingense JCM 13560]|uniref:UspA domain protein n=1 Tax=Halorubrum aidingense JCM 13560 TaxID=1230454 RepID=M0PCE0_9EURY|nr:universal stress protein [Halorubrum aidingense]EMA67706.1 UspA domain protein [Halorubrum aidingense JCM 13560]
MGKRILVAVDGSADAIEALQFAASEWPDAEVTALHVISPADSMTGAESGFPGAVDQWYDSATQRGERILREAADAVDRDIDTRLEVGRPTSTILAVASGERAIGDAAEDSDGDTDADDREATDADGREAVDADPFDHVVLASRGRTGLSRVLLGSVAESVVRRAEIPVTVVR